MKEYIREALGLNWSPICFGTYLPPPNPTINYFPFEKTELQVEFMGEWDDVKHIEYRISDTKNHKFIHHLVWKKGKDGYVYLWDKATKKKWTDPNYRFKCSEDGFILRECLK